MLTLKKERCQAVSSIGHIYTTSKKGIHQSGQRFRDDSVEQLNNFFSSSSSLQRSVVM